MRTASGVRVFGASAGKLPPSRPADATAEIKACLKEAAALDPFLASTPPAITCPGFTAEGYVLEEGSAAEATLAEAHGCIFGRKLPSYVMPAYLDGRVFALYAGTPALVYGPTSRNIHGFDEAVKLESLRRVTKVVALFVAGWCGVEEG